MMDGDVQHVEVGISMMEMPIPRQMARGSMFPTTIEAPQSLEHLVQNIMWLSRSLPVQETLKMEVKASSVSKRSPRR